MLQLDMEQWTGSKLGKESTRLYIVTLLNLHESTLCKMTGWMNHKLESRFPEEIAITSDMQMITTLMVESKEELKSLLMRVEEKSEKTGLKLNPQKTKIMTSDLITSWQTER